MGKFINKRKGKYNMSKFVLLFLCVVAPAGLALFVYAMFKNMSNKIESNGVSIERKKEVEKIEEHTFGPSAWK
jgi:hypothetical protein